MRSLVALVSQLTVKLTSNNKGNSLLFLLQCPCKRCTYEHMLFLYGVYLVNLSSEMLRRWCRGKDTHYGHS